MNRKGQYQGHGDEEVAVAVLEMMWAKTKVVVMGIGKRQVDMKMINKFNLETEHVA